MKTFQKDKRLFETRAQRHNWSNWWLVCQDHNRSTVCRCFLNRALVFVSTAAPHKTQTAKTNLYNFVSDTRREREKNHSLSVYLNSMVCLHVLLLLCVFSVSCLLLYLIKSNPRHGHGDGRDMVSAWDNHRQSEAAEEPRKHLIGRDSLWIRIIELDLYQHSTTCRARSGQL